LYACRLCIYLGLLLLESVSFQLSHIVHNFSLHSLAAMLGPSTLFAASAAFTVLRGVDAANISPVSQEPAQPACTNSFQSFVYAGCFKDTGDPRALLYDSKLPVLNMTVEKCVSFCKGIGSIFYLAYSF
jgi:hypothetical protein